MSVRLVGCAGDEQDEDYSRQKGQEQRLERARCVLGSERRLASSDAGSDGERVTRGTAEMGRIPRGRGVIKDLWIMRPLIFMILSSCVCLKASFLWLKASEGERNTIRKKNMEDTTARMHERAQHSERETWGFGERVTQKMRAKPCPPSMQKKQLVRHHK